MGCDIHCYIEYRTKGEDRWDSFGARINPGRYYDMFALLAGVRNYDEVKPVAKSRGMPEDAGFCSEKNNLIYIDDKNRKYAADLVEIGQSTYVNGFDGKPVWFTNPDWHTHSWLTTAEFEQAIQQYKQEHKYSICEYDAILAAMKSFESQGYESRLVFWFDN